MHYYNNYGALPVLKLIHDWPTRYTNATAALWIWRSSDTALGASIRISASHSSRKVCQLSIRPRSNMTCHSMPASCNSPLKPSIAICPRNTCMCIFLARSKKLSVSKESDDPEGCLIKRHCRRMLQYATCPMPHAL